MTPQSPRRSAETLAHARRALAEPARPRARTGALLAAALLLAVSGAGAAAAMILGPGASVADPVPGAIRAPR